MNLLAGELEKLVSEGRNPRTLDLDLLSAREIIEKINAEDGEAAIAVGRETDAIASAVERIVDAREQGHHVIVDEVEEQVLLRLDVVIEGAGLQAHTGCELAQAHGLKAMFMDKVQTRFPDGRERLLAGGACRSRQ